MNNNLTGEQSIELFSVSISQKPFDTSKYAIALTLSILPVGLGLGILLGQFMNQSQTTIKTNFSPTARLTSMPLSIPAVRIADPIVNGKRRYSTKGFGITFDYPKEWSVKEEFIDDFSDGKNESHVQVGNLYITRNQHPDGPGDSSPVLYSENISIDQSQGELVIKGYCWNEEILGISEKCNKVYGRMSIIIDEVDNYWSFEGPDVATREDIQKELQPIRELLASVKFVK